MHCRAGCGACCIAPSISSPIPGMPHGKKAGERCIHLDADHLCRLFNDARRPQVCRDFKANMDACGDSFDSAIEKLQQLEIETGA